MKRKVVVKMGGSNLEAENVLSEFAEAVKLVSDDCHVCIVHGGGKDIARQLNKLGREFKFINGLRVTDDETIDTVEMVLSGLVNKWIARALERAGLRAVGVSGTDLGLFHAEKLEIPEGDLGYVGTIHDVNTELIRLFIEHDIVPVVSPISIGTDCRAYNVNADHAAQKCAEQWKADDLVYITNVPGITIDSEVRPVIKTTDMEAVLNTGAVTGGMIPKLTSSVSAVENGVGRVHIIGWKGPDSIRDSLDSSHSWGTVIEA